MQNIDTLERVAGLEPQDLVEAHGTFYTSHCVSSSCRQEYSLSWMKGEAGIPDEATPPAPGPRHSQVSKWFGIIVI